MRINGASFFKQSFELKIKGDLIPKATAGEIIGELQSLFALHNAGATPSAKEVFKPTKEFHTARHRNNFEFIGFGCSTPKPAAALLLEGRPPCRP